MRTHFKHSTCTYAPTTMFTQAAPSEANHVGCYRLFTRHRSPPHGNRTNCSSTFPANKKQMAVQINLRHGPWRQHRFLATITAATLKSGPEQIGLQANVTAAANTTEIISITTRPQRSICYGSWGAPLTPTPSAPQAAAHAAARAAARTRAEAGGGPSASAARGGAASSLAAAQTVCPE